MRCVDLRISLNSTHEITSSVHLSQPFLFRSARNEEEAKRAEELLRKREETEEERRVRIDKLEKVFQI